MSVSPEDNLGRCTYQLSLIAPFCQSPPPVSHQNVFIKDSFTKLLTTNLRPHHSHLQVDAVVVVAAAGTGCIAGGLELNFEDKGLYQCHFLVEVRVAQHLGGGRAGIEDDAVVVIFSLVPTSGTSHEITAAHLSTADLLGGRHVTRMKTRGHSHAPLL